MQFVFQNFNGCISLSTFAGIMACSLDVQPEFVPTSFCSDYDCDQLANFLVNETALDELWRAQGSLVVLQHRYYACSYMYMWCVYVPTFRVYALELCAAEEVYCASLSVVYFPHRPQLRVALRSRSYLSVVTAASFVHCLCNTISRNNNKPYIFPRRNMR